MSASHDSSHKITFVYSNFYDLYRKGLDAAQQAPDASPFAGNPVLKTENLKSTVADISPAVSGNNAIKLRLKDSQPLPRPALNTQHEALKGLKRNLESLNDLHSRLRFMLGELEELVKE